MFDLGPATGELSRLVAGTGDDQLDRPTPCPDWTVADLLAHVHQFSSVFTSNARKAPIAPPATLVDDWRTAIPDQLDRLAAAWADTAAWQGRTSAGGIEMDAADNAVVAIEELTTHGWDLARATGRPIEVGDVALDQIDRFCAMFGADAAAGHGPFGREGPVPADASRLDRALARLGRDPRWTPAG